MNEQDLTEYRVQVEGLKRDIAGIITSVNGLGGRVTQVERDIHALDRQQTTIITTMDNMGKQMLIDSKNADENHRELKSLLMTTIQEIKSQRDKDKQEHDVKDDKIEAKWDDALKVIHSRLDSLLSRWWSIATWGLISATSLIGWLIVQLLKSKGII